ncbi:aminoacyl-tRNA hydrolase [Chloroflexota bacterium]
MKLIVGLGNPGQNRADNRHNIGFICLNHFARTQGIKLDKKQGKARTGMGKAASEEVVLAKPQTYMNKSGQSVSLLMDKFEIGSDDIIVIHDDLDLPLGKIRIRQGGGSGGHKGINSIITESGNADFIRIRIGIGRPNRGELESSTDDDEIVNYVLGTFTQEEEKVLNETIPTVSKAILYLISDGLDATMSCYN